MYELGRKKRFWVPDSFYHIVCRGNRRDPLFMDDDDFRMFLHILVQINKKTSFELASYCLMTNHFHLQLRSNEYSISKVMALINKRYADYYNTRYNLTGHVFEKRFYDRLIDPGAGMLKVSRYIHLNPVEAGIVRRPEEYPWSSYRSFTRRFSNPLLNIDVILDLFPGNIREKRWRYVEFVEKKEE